jgi:hypothetical protein
MGHGNEDPLPKGLGTKVPRQSDLRVSE